MPENGKENETRLERARQRIRELCEALNALDKARGGNGRKVRVSDYLEDI